MGNYYPTTPKFNIGKNNRVRIADLPSIMRTLKEDWAPKYMAEIIELNKRKAIAILGIDSFSLPDEIKPRVRVTLPMILSDLKPGNYHEWINLVKSSRTLSETTGVVQFQLPITESISIYTNPIYSEGGTYSVSCAYKSGISDLVSIILKNLDYHRLASDLTDSFSKGSKNKFAAIAMRTRTIAEDIFQILSSAIKANFEIKSQGYGRDNKFFVRVEIKEKNSFSPVFQFDFTVTHTQQPVRRTTPGELQRNFTTMYPELLYHPQPSEILEKVQSIFAYCRS